MPTAIVTGASTGIGLAASARLAKAGFHVVATMRDTNKSTELEERARAEGQDIQLDMLDVTDGQSVHAVVDAAIAEHGSIDVLVNNAGFGHVGTLEQTPLDDARGVFETNFFGTWRMIAAVLPHMRAARRGRIINISSVGGVIGQPFNDAYCASKFAVEGLSESLAPVMRKFGVYISIVEPGAVNTSFVDNVAGSVGQALSDPDDPYQPFLRSYLAASREVFASAGQTGDDIAEVIVRAATDEVPHLRYQTSPMSRAIAQRKFADPDGDSVLEVSSARLT